MRQRKTVLLILGHKCMRMHRRSTCSRQSFRRGCLAQLIFTTCWNRYFMLTLLLSGRCSKIALWMLPTFLFLVFFDMELDWRYDLRHHTGLDYVAFHERRCQFLLLRCLADNCRQVLVWLSCCTTRTHRITVTTLVLGKIARLVVLAFECTIAAYDWFAFLRAASLLLLIVESFCAGAFTSTICLVTLWLIAVVRCGCFESWLLLDVQVRVLTLQISVVITDLISILE